MRRSILAALLALSLASGCNDEDSSPSGSEADAGETPSRPKPDDQPNKPPEPPEEIKGRVTATVSMPPAFDGKVQGIVLSMYAKKPAEATFGTEQPTVIWSPRTEDPAFPFEFDLALKDGKFGRTEGKGYFVIVGYVSDEQTVPEHGTDYWWMSEEITFDGSDHDLGEIELELLD